MIHFIHFILFGFLSINNYIVIEKCAVIRIKFEFFKSAFLYLGF